MLSQRANCRCWIMHGHKSWEGSWQLGWCLKACQIPDYSEEYFTAFNLEFWSCLNLPCHWPEKKQASLKEQDPIAQASLLTPSSVGICLIKWWVYFASFQTLQFEHENKSYSPCCSSSSTQPRSLGQDSGGVVQTENLTLHQLGR